MLRQTLSRIVPPFKIAHPNVPVDVTVTRSAVVLSMTRPELKLPVLVCVTFKLRMIEFAPSMRMPFPAVEVISGLTPADAP